jgi:hypothetical protein
VTSASWLWEVDLQVILPQRPGGLLAGGVGDMEPVMARLPLFLNLRGQRASVLKAAQAAEMLWLRVL